MTQIATRPNGAVTGEIMDRVIAAGDLSRLTPADRCLYYNQVCVSVGLNPLTRPFEYITLNNKLTLYARKDATDQLRELKGISIYRLDKEVDGELYVVTAYAENAKGRKDTDTGAVTVGQLKGEARANAIMKAVTKAKRRVTLSICGLGMLDETEVDSVPGARHTYVDAQTGEIMEPRYQRNSDPEPYVERERVIDPLTGRPAVTEPPRHADGSRMNTSDQAVQRGHLDDGDLSPVTKKGIANLKGWCVNRKLDPEDRALHLYLLNRAASAWLDHGQMNNWTSRKDLTADDWTACVQALGKLKPAELNAWMDAYRESAEQEEALPMDVETGPSCDDLRAFD